MRVEIAMQALDSFFGYAGAGAYVFLAAFSLIQFFDARRYR